MIFFMLAAPADSLREVPAAVTGCAEASRLGRACRPQASCGGRHAPSWLRPAGVSASAGIGTAQPAAREEVLERLIGELPGEVIAPNRARGLGGPRSIGC